MFSLRLSYKGKRPRITLGNLSEGWTPAAAERKREDVMGALALGVSLEQLFPAVVSEVSADTRESTLRELVDEYNVTRKGARAKKTITADEWAQGYVLEHMGDTRPSQLTPKSVDRFRAALIAQRDHVAMAAAACKPLMETRTIQRNGRTVTREQRRRPLQNAQINRIIGHLAVLIDEAIEENRTNLTMNPARGRKRKLPSTREPGSFLEIEQTLALMEGAALNEAHAREHRPVDALPHAAIVTSLVLLGPRIDELCGLTRGRLNLGAQVVRIGRSKTTAGMREVDLVFSVLIDALSDYLARPTSWGAASCPLFASANGNHLRSDNIRDRVVDPAVKCANALLLERGQATIEHATPHSLRRTYIALLLTAGADVAYVMAQVGHKDPKLTLAIYNRLLKRKRREEYRERLDALLAPALKPDNVEGFRPFNRPSGPATALALPNLTSAGAS